MQSPEIGTANRRTKAVVFTLIGLGCLAWVIFLVVTKVSVLITLQHFEPSAPNIETTQRPEVVARGRHLTHDICGCVSCHGSNLAGVVLQQSPWSATIVSANLTGGRFDPSAWAQAVRSAVDSEGHALWLMPAQSAFAALGHDDLRAIISYLATLPPVAHPLPPKSLGPWGRAQVVMRQLPLVQAVGQSAEPQSPDPSASAAYGAYLAKIARCESCHLSATFSSAQWQQGFASRQENPQPQGETAPAGPHGGYNMAPVELQALSKHFCP